MASKLQVAYKVAYNNSASKKSYTRERWQNSIYNLGLECYIKATQGKLIEVDYKGNQRQVKGKGK